MNGQTEPVQNIESTVYQYIHKVFPSFERECFVCSVW